jgi:hypothetical protein
MAAMSGMNSAVRRTVQIGVAAGLATLAIAGAAPALADDLNTTTCSEQQLVASIQQNDPLIWARINSNPKLEEELRVGLAALLAAPPGQRQQEVNALEQTLGQQQWSGVSDDIMNSAYGPIGRAVNNCHSA